MKEKAARKSNQARIKTPSRESRTLPGSITPEIASETYSAEVHKAETESPGTEVRPSATLDESERGLGTLLRMPYQSMMTHGVEPALLAAGFDEIRSAHLPVIQGLGRHPQGLRATELATYARITKQSMGYLLDHLSAANYVERVPDPTDQRAKVVRLTPRGRATGLQIQAAVREVEASWAQRIGPERMQDLREILQDLVTKLDP